jgi:hypothetical protein
LFSSRASKVRTSPIREKKAPAISRAFFSCFSNRANKIRTFPITVITSPESSKSSESSGSAE